VPLTGERRGALITHSDITARKRADAEAVHLRDELALAGRVMTMGVLSASLTHELSQPLAAVLGNAQAAKRFVERECREHLELEAILADVVAAGNRASGIVRHLRNWVKTGRLDLQQLNMNDVVNEVVAVLQGDLLHRSVVVVCTLAPRLPDIRGDRLQMQQVLLNLMVNACDAMRHNDQGERRIHVRTARVDGRVQLSVEDTGTGFPPDHLDSIFEPFVTTKPAGLGLGLALCRAIVQAHEGDLSAINNQEGRGATVCCTIPCVDARSQDVSDSSGGVAVSPR
jgi:C4-dicarboxylate-specific signal transduction histidine kinase